MRAGHAFATGVKIASDELPEPAGEAAADAADETTTVPPALLERCLGQLPNEAQQCLQFAYVSGRSHLEISQLIGKPLGTVKSWIRRALFTLRECLES